MMRAVCTYRKIFHDEKKSIFTPSFLIKNQIPIFGNKISSLIRYHNFIIINKELMNLSLDRLFYVYFLFFHFIRIYDIVMVDNKLS